MWSELLFVCVLCLVWLALKNRKRASSSEHKLPPAMDGELPIIGHMHIILYYVTNIYKFLKTMGDACTKKGGVIVFKFGSELYYFITDPQDSLTAASACLQRHYAYNLADVWLGNSLVLSSGDTWRHRRKLLNPAFSLPVIHGFLDVFNGQAKKLVNSVETHVGKGPFNHSIQFLKTASETLCVGTFGINPKEAVNFTEKYEHALFELLRLLINKYLRFWLQNEWIYRLLGMKKKQDALVETLHSMSEKVLQEKRLARKNEALKAQTNGTEYKPFLDRILDLSENNAALTDKDIREETDSIVFTGFESTSNQMTFTLLLLGAHPEVQDKLHKELIEVLGEDRDVEKDDLNKLVYTNAVIMESLRVIPSVPVLLRSVNQDVKLKNYTMRAGSNCVIIPLMPFIGGTSGTEGDLFRPERWLNADFKSQQEFAGFGLGKRSCIGRTYAMVAMKVMLAHFIRRYRVHGDMSNLQLSADLVLKPISGHEISIERRT